MKKNFIPDNAVITHYSMPNYNEIVYSKNQSSYVPVQKVSKRSYVDVSTGEVKDYKKSASKTVDNFKKQFKKVPRYIKGYFVGDDSEVHITLTYSIFINDFELITKDFKLFFKKIKRRYSPCIYFVIKEPHISGSWHIHCLLKRTDNKTFNITEDEVRRLWGNGLEVKVRSINDIDKLCWYFDITRNKSKLDRLIFYPVNKRIYLNSRCMSVKKNKTTYKAALQSMNDNELVYRSEMDIKITDDSGKEVIINRIKYEQYKKI